MAARWDLHVPLPCFNATTPFLPTPFTLSRLIAKDKQSWKTTANLPKLLLHMRALRFDDVHVVITWVGWILLSLYPQDGERVKRWRGQLSDTAVSFLSAYCSMFQFTQLQQTAMYGSQWHSFASPAFMLLTNGTGRVCTFSFLTLCST